MTYYKRYDLIYGLRVDVFINFLVLMVGISLSPNAVFLSLGPLGLLIAIGDPYK